MAVACHQQQPDGWTCGWAVAGGERISGSAIVWVGWLAGAMGRHMPAFRDRFCGRLLAGCIATLSVG
eukprot:364334-Chlamydomonas_euryale.AAC.13